MTPTPTSTSSPTGPTLGKTNVGAQLDSGNSNNMTGSQVTVGSTPAVVASLSVHVGVVDVSPNNQYSMAIYTNLAGQPSGLLAQTPTGTLSANSWNTLTLSVPVTLNSNTSYWLLYNSNGTSSNVNNMQFDNASSNIGVFKTQTFGSWPNTLSGGTTGAWSYSIYATLASSSSPSPTPSITPQPTATPSTSPTPTTIPGDLNGDGHVNLTDLSILATNYGLAGASIINTAADINKDGVVNLTDLSLLAAHYGS